MTDNNKGEVLSTAASTATGLRFNEGKIPLHLISWPSVKEVAKVLDFGAKKYAARNWEKGLSFSDTFASLQRHIVAWYGGEDKDPETGLSHMAHVMCNAMFLMHFILTGTGKDDRPHKLNQENDKEIYDATAKPEPTVYDLIREDVRKEQEQRDGKLVERTDWYLSYDGTLPTRSRDC